MESRLPFDATTPEGRHNYLATRARQLQSRGYKVLSLVNQYTKQDDGIAMLIVEHKNGGQFYSVYLSPGIRGKGAFKEVHAKMDMPVITIRDCDIAGYLEFNGIDHIVEQGYFDTLEYALIEGYYGNRMAKRSGVWLMNHIDEGLTILDQIGASDDAKAIFCLHPLTQNDVDLASNIELLGKYPKLNWKGALEYRETANAYLAQRDIEDISEIRLSDNPDVNNALIADKVQNYKDFMLYHYGSHKDSDRLFDYFHNWFDRLAISDKLLLDLLINLYDNDYMKANDFDNKEFQIPRILMHTRIERENRS